MTAIAYADRREWLEARRRGIGGSDAAAIIGVSPWRTAVDVWEDKLGIAEDRPPTAAMDWGNRLEAVVADAVAERVGIKLRRVRRILVHPEHPVIIGSLDRIGSRAGDPVVEIKTARSDDGWATEEEAPRLEPARRVPIQYYVQGQHYLGLTGRDMILFGVLVGGSDLRVIPVPRDDGFVEDLFAEEVAWWERYVETGERPPLTAGDAPKLARIYPTGSGEKVATPEVDQAVAELLEVRAREDELARVRAELEVRIKDYLGEASDLVAPSGRVTWRSSERTSVAWEEVAGVYRRALERVRAHPHGAVGAFTDAVLSELAGTTDLDDVRDLYTTKSSVRTFRLDRKTGGTK